MIEHTAIVERVARAICAADTHAPDPDAPIMIGHQRALAWEGRKGMAVAAINVLSETILDAIDPYERTP